MYLEMKNKTRSQRIKILDIANNLIDVNITNVFSRKKDSIKFIDCLDIARDNLLKNEPTLYEVSFSSSNDLTYDRHERIRHPDKLRKYSLHKKKFPSPIEYFKDINLPIHIINSWSDLSRLSEYELQEKYALIMSKADKKPLHMDYWINLINEKRKMFVNKK